MDTISSSEFRKSFAKLERSTEVTVNGHIIGIWVPGASIKFADPPLQSVMDGPSVLLPAERAYAQAKRPFAEFRPVPKPGKGR